MKQHRQGFTLVELLLTLGVLAIGLGSILTLLPGITNFSRELRDKDRMEIFAESIFDALDGLDALDWELLQEESGEELLSEKLTFASLIGPQIFQVSSIGPQAFEASIEESEWPDTGGTEGLTPVFYYSLRVQVNSPLEMEARLTVRPESSLIPTEYSQVFHPQVQAW